MPKADQNQDQEEKPTNEVEQAKLDEPEFEDIRRVALNPMTPGAEAPGDDPEKPAEEGGELEDMTKAMKRKLMRDRRNSERKLAEKEAEFQETIAAQEKRIRDLENRVSAKTDEGSDDLKSIEEQIVKAMEVGDSAKVASLNRKLAEAVSAKSRPRHQVDEPGDLDDGQRKPEPRPKKPSAGLIPRVQQWVDEQPWWDDPSHGHVQSFIREKVDRKLRDAGYSPTEDAYYEELERIVEEKYPGVVVSTRASEREREFSQMLDQDRNEEDDFQVTPKDGSPRRQVSRAPVGGADDGAATGSGSGDSPRRKGATRITAEEVHTMRTFRLDPTDPKQVEEFRRFKG